MIKYLLALATFVFFGIAILLAHFMFPIVQFVKKIYRKIFKKPEPEVKPVRTKGWELAEKITINYVLIGLAIALFVVRFMCYDDIQRMSGWEQYQHMNVPQSPFNAMMGELCIWLIVPANLFLFMRAFSTQKTSTWFVKFISLPIIFVTLFFIDPMLINMIGSAHSNIAEMKTVEFMLPLELGATFALSIYFFIKDFKVRIAKHEYAYVGLLSSLGSLFAIPTYILMFFFGQGRGGHYFYDMSADHRYLIYIGFIAVPLIIYFLLRNLGERKIRFALLYISLGVMVGFMYANKFSKIDQPWSYPWHLCNTAVFILPICLIFKPKRLFYFTYFINVFGALMATLMPNYDAYDTFFVPEVIRFVYNHMLAFWMPLLMVALKIYERPKLKQYFYSVGWLLVYFLLMLALNVNFNGVGPGHVNHDVDYFFIYTDKIADKLGDWAENIYKNSLVQFQIKGVTYSVRPLYQALYFIGYVLFGFAMWFVYQLGFDIADSHYELHLRLKGIRQDHIALKSALDGRSIEEPMEKDAGIKLELEHFSKKYGSNKHYSVHDVSFEVNAGEVFGFLGPNGAGKSTIIKSIVGIQPITEGKMRVCGYDVQSQPVQAKSNIGFVPDHYALYEKLTGREYINYIADIFEVSKEDREERIQRYVKLFELEQSIDNKIKTYSHGMKQKITIISALVHNPKVWILDEPLTGLDPTSIYQVKQCMLNHAKEGNIVFFSSHLIDIVEKLCDRVGIIKHGELQVVDSVENIEKSGKTLEQFYLNIIGDNVTQAGK